MYYKYTNRIASIEIWGPVPASATHANAQIHNKDTQLKYTARIHKFKSTNNSIGIWRPMPATYAYLQIYSYVQGQIQIEMIIQSGTYSTTKVDSSLHLSSIMVPGVRLSLWVVVEGVV